MAVAVVIVAVYLSFIYLSIHPSIYPSIHLSIYLSICLSVCLPASLKTKLYCETSSILIWQHQKAQPFCKVPSILTLTTSKTKQFCETSSMIEVDNFKNEAILRDILQKWKVECRADGLVPMRFVIFPHVSEVLRLPRKSEARSYEVLHMSHKIIFPKLKSEAGVFCTFLLRTVLRDTTPCTF